MNIDISKLENFGFRWALLRYDTGKFAVFVSHPHTSQQYDSGMYDTPQEAIDKAVEGANRFVI